MQKTRTISILSYQLGIYVYPTCSQISIVVSYLHQQDVEFRHITRNYICIFFSETSENSRCSHFDDDVKATFRHCKYYPGASSDFSLITSNLLFVPLGGTFGSITSPAYFESITRKSIHLAEFLSGRINFLDGKVQYHY